MRARREGQGSRSFAFSKSPPPLGAVFAHELDDAVADLKEARGGYLLNLELFHDKQQLVETEAKIAPESPLFIRGPLHARGQILFVVLVKP